MLSLDFRPAMLARLITDCSPAKTPAAPEEIVEAMAWGPAGELFVASAARVWMGSQK